MIWYPSLFLPVCAWVSISLCGVQCMLGQVLEDWWLCDEVIDGGLEGCNEAGPL